MQDMCFDMLALCSIIAMLGLAPASSLVPNLLPDLASDVEPKSHFDAIFFFRIHVNKKAPD